MFSLRKVITQGAKEMYFHRSGEFRLVDLISRAEGDAQTQRRVSSVVVSRKGLIT